MKKLFFSLIIACIVFTALFASINFTTMLEINFDADFGVYLNKTTFSGYGSIEKNTIGMAIDKWPNFASDHYSIKLDQPYSDSTKIDQSFEFKIIVKLNELSTTTVITDFPQTGRYQGKMTCCFNNIHSGSYTLSIAIYVNGSTEPDDFEERTISIT